MTRRIGRRVAWLAVGMINMLANTMAYAVTQDRSAIGPLH